MVQRQQRFFKEQKLSAKKDFKWIFSIVKNFNDWKIEHMLNDGNQICLTSIYLLYSSVFSIGIAICQLQFTINAKKFHSCQFLTLPSQFHFHFVFIVFCADLMSLTFNDERFFSHRHVSNSQQIDKFSSR